MSNNSINEPMVTITMTMDQARLLSSVCDIVCRLHLNQFDVIKDVCHRKDNHSLIMTRCRISMGIETVIQPRIISQFLLGYLQQPNIQ